MVSFRGSVLQAGRDIFDLKVGMVFDYFLFRDLRGQDIEHVLNPDSHASNTGTPAALIRIECNSVIYKVMRSASFQGW